MIEHASDLRGILIISREEGAKVGTLSAIHVDPDTKCIAAFAYRTRRLGGDEFFVPMNEVLTVGRDVIIISSEKSAHRVSETSKPPGRSLKDLQGSRITTMDGRHLGTLVDLDFSGGDWVISELTLAEDKELAVEADEIKIGDDILVPAAYAERVRSTKEPKSGFLRRTFGSEAIDDTKKALRRVLSRERKPPTEKSEESKQSKT